MKPGKTLSVLGLSALLAAGTLATAARAAEPVVVTAELDKPFVLVAGVTGRMEPEGLEVTLRSASDDSGCFSPQDCSLALFKGTIALSLGEKKQLVTVHAVLKKDETVNLDFADYEIRFGAVRRLGKDNIQATFTVTKALEKEED